MLDPAVARRCLARAQVHSPVASAQLSRTRRARAARRRPRCRHRCPRRPPSGRDARQRVAPAQGGQHAGGFGEPRLEARRAGSPSAAAAPPVAPEQPRPSRSSGSTARSSAALTPIPSTAQPSCGRPRRAPRPPSAVHEHAGPLPSRPPQRGRHRETGAQRQQRVGVADHQRDRERSRAGSTTRALAAAPGGLLAPR